MGHPQVEGPINYPNGVPEFKYYERIINMSNYEDNVHDEYRFSTISEFKWCIKFGGEIEFEWKGKAYSITHPNGQICISEGCYYKDGKYYNACSHTEYSPNDEGLYETADELLEFMVGEDRFRDIVTKMKVVARTL